LIAATYPKLVRFEFKIKKLPPGPDPIITKSYLAEKLWIEDLFKVLVC